MKQELIKPIVKVGNSAGIILPKEWLNGKEKVELIETPKDIKKELLEVLDSYLPDIIGIYLTGSYARGEETPESDIDILVELNGPIGWDFTELNDYLEQLLGNRVDLVSIKALKPQLKDDILSEVVYVCKNR